MRTFRLLTFLLAAALVIPSFARKKKDKNDYGVWLAGVAASFTDSLVYITDIQYLDSAYYNTKGLLSQRQQYSLQLKEYLEQDGRMQHRTCFMFFNKKKKRLEKEMAKLRRNYQKGDKMDVRNLDDFRFTRPEED